MGLPIHLAQWCGNKARLFAEITQMASSPVANIIALLLCNLINWASTVHVTLSTAVFYQNSPSAYST